MNASTSVPTSTSADYHAIGSCFDEGDRSRERQSFPSVLSWMGGPGAASAELPVGQRTLTPLQRWVFVPVCLLTMAACALLTIDMPLAEATTTRAVPDELHRFVRSIEPFATPHGQVVILVGIFALFPHWRRMIPRLAAAALGGGLAANVVKLCVGRHRPKYFDFSHESVFDTFGGLLPFLTDGPSLNSFPSAHTASAVAFAVVLTRLIPRGVWFFGGLAVLAGLQRLEVCQHFTSDVLVGAAVGWFVGQSLCFLPLASRWFDRLETGDPQQSQAA